MMAKLNNRITCRKCTAVLLAVVFAAVSMYVPAEVNASERDINDAPVEGTYEEGIRETEMMDQEAAETETEVTESETEAAESEPEVTESDQEATLDGQYVNEPEISETAMPEAEAEQNGEYDGFIYKLKDDTAKAEIAEMKEEIAKLDDGQEVETVQEGSLYAADSIDTIETVAETENIEYIEPNYIARVTGDTVVPNDPGYRKDQYRWQLENIGANKAWSRGVLGQRTDGSRDRVTVAILDTGLIGTGRYSFRHEDINYSHVLEGYNAFTKNSNTQDDNGHGTYVTGIIAAKGNNGKGLVGAASSVYVYPVKVFNRYGVSTEMHLIDGMNKAIEKGVDVINISAGFAGGIYPRVMEDACRKAEARGIIVVAASGNTGRGNTSYPAGFSSVIGAASVDRNNNRSWFSTYNDGVDAAAPGEGVMTTGIKGRSSYVQVNGTSFSCPYVASLALLAKSINPKITKSGFRQLLEATSKDRGSRGRDDYYGYGVVDFDKACRKLLDGRRVSIKNAQAKLSYKTVFYTGTRRTPAVRLKHGFVTLKKGVDYSVSYRNNIREGKASVKINTGSSRGYRGEVTRTFRIVKKDISKAKVSLSSRKYAYNGKSRMPKVTVRQAGRKLKAGTDYRLICSKGRKNVGSYKITIKGKGKIRGTKTVSFRIYPRKTSITKLHGKNDKFTVKWRKKLKQTSGYQIKYYAKNAGSKAVTVTVKNNAATAKTVKNLKSKKKYYVKIRTYKTVKGKKYYSGWSMRKAVRTL